MVIDFDSGDIDILNFRELSICDMDILNLHELIFCVIEVTFWSCFILTLMPEPRPRLTPHYNGTFLQFTASIISQEKVCGFS
jgi:hypothetical protein